MRDNESDTQLCFFFYSSAPIGTTTSRAEHLCRRRDKRRTPSTMVGTSKCVGRWGGKRGPGKPSSATPFRKAPRLRRGKRAIEVCNGPGVPDGIAIYRSKSAASPKTCTGDAASKAQELSVSFAFVSIVGKQRQKRLGAELHVCSLRLLLVKWFACVGANRAEERFRNILSP